MKLVVVEEGTRSALDFQQPVIRVGRAIDNDIRLSGIQASRHHCRIELRGAEAIVVDLGSANGTQVNGERALRRKLQVGDVIGVGGARIHVEEITQGRPAAAPRAEAPPATVDGGLKTLTSEEERQVGSLVVFSNVARALARETDFSALLRLILDSSIQLVRGERGFLLLDAQAERKAVASDPRAWKVRLARSFDRADIPIPSSRLSMGIAHKVAESGEPLLSVDAGRDARFSGMASVEDLKLRSVMCLPIAGDEGPEGLLYIDNRLQQGAFSQDDLELCQLLAHQAAIAIRNARLLSELRERNERLMQSAEQIRSLNDQLGRKIRDRDSELSIVRAELGRERGRYDYGNIVGASDEMRRVFQELDRIIEAELPVLIQGESGTGKELIARAIHFNGPRKELPFVVENCAALPDTLLESELFGHTRGAFTGAERTKKGLLEQAHGGTLFLDEIGDMSPEMQKKLLRVLQEGEVRPLGSTQTLRVDVRLLAASHQDLEELVRQGRFREDLFYRVNVLTLRLPALRERRDDVPLLAAALLTRAAREAGRGAPHLPHEVLAALAAYNWPGNVRELENEMRRVLLLAPEEVRLEHLSAAIRAGPRLATDPIEVNHIGDLRSSVVRFERQAIQDALDRNGGNKSRAAKELGISRFALQRKLEKYGLEQRARPGPS
jgi:transcriptional regulator with GAF, ATPase, and Fis domain